MLHVTHHKQVDILISKNQAVHILYTMKHLRGKLLWFVNKIHYVEKPFVVRPQPPILVLKLQSREVYSGKAFAISKSL